MAGPLESPATEPTDDALEALDPATRTIVEGLAPFDEVRTAEQIVGFRRDCARIVIEIGRRLVQAREHYRATGLRSEGEGFRAFCKGCGIGHSTAYNHIRIAERLAETGLLESAGLLDSSPLLNMNSGVKKLLAITELDPDEIRELENGGSVEDIGDLDEIEKMRAGELREAVRRHKHGESRAVERVHDLERKVAEETSLRQHYEKVAREGPDAPVEPLVRFLEINQMAREWLRGVQDLPRPERETLFGQAVTVHASLADDMMVLVREERGRLPFPTTEHLTGDHA